MGRVLNTEVQLGTGESRQPGECLGEEDLINYSIGCRRWVGSRRPQSKPCARRMKLDVILETDEQPNL